MPPDPLPEPLPPDPDPDPLEPDPLPPELPAIFVPLVQAMRSIVRHTKSVQNAIFQGEFIFLGMVLLFFRMGRNLGTECRPI